MHIYILVSIALWWAALVRSVKKNNLYIAERAISHQLTGKFSDPVDIAFLLLAGAWFVSPWAMGIGWSAVDIPAFLAGIGTAGAMLTRKVWDNGQLHVISAALAFGFGAIALMVFGHYAGRGFVFWMAVISLVPAILQVLRIAFTNRSGSYIEWVTAALLTGTFAISVI